MKLFLLLLITLLAIKSIAQRETNIWYFGDSAGVDFNTGVPIPLLDNTFSTWEGVATFSDSLGNLLMYTDGRKIWNKNHEIMPNGADLNGNWSSTESAIIVPQPSNDSLYYLFTVDMQAGPKGFCYSLINMKLDNGNGDVTDKKNIKLIDRVGEKVTAVRHWNNRDVWILTHEWNTDSFYVYLLTNEGLNLTPKIVEIGSGHYEREGLVVNSLGYMKASPNGKKIAVVIKHDGIVELFDFDNSTGDIFNPLQIEITSPYGVEFSHNTQKLYITGDNYLYQADISLSTGDSIIASVQLIDSTDFHTYGAVQMATDGKIYVAHDFSSYIGVINYPERIGELCGFIENGFFLGGRKSRLGLPNFVQTYFLPPPFNMKEVCFGDTAFFQINEMIGFDSVRWNFGDILSVNNFSNNPQPWHLYTDAGVFKVTAMFFLNGDSLFHQRYIRINSLPTANLGNDTILCRDSILVLNVNQSNTNYLWSDSTTLAQFSIYQSGKYWVRLTHQFTGCINSDTIKVLYKNPPPIFLGNDTSFCFSDSLILYAKSENIINYKWQDNSTDSIFYAKASGLFWVQIQDIDKCTNTDTIVLSNYPLPEIYLGEDTIICYNSVIWLNAVREKSSYLWQDNSVDSVYMVTLAGLYHVTIIDSMNCKNSDTIEIFEKRLPIANLGRDTTLCEGEYLILSSDYEHDVNYLWQDNSQDITFIVNSAGTFWVEMTNICGTVRDEIQINYKYCGDIYIPNVITPNSDNHNDYFKIKGIDSSQWELQIYNRWGKMVYQSNNYQNDWKAQDCSSGVYFYLLQNPETKQMFSGFLHVIK